MNVNVLQITVESIAQSAILTVATLHVVDMATVQIIVLIHLVISVSVM